MYIHMDVILDRYGKSTFKSLVTLHRRTLHMYQITSLLLLRLLLTMSQTSYKEWLETSINEGSIYCCTEHDIKLDPLHIGHGAFGVVYKAAIKHKNGIGN